MRTSIKGTNITILESTREYVDRKLVLTTEKFLIKGNEPVALDIEVEKTTDHHKKGKIFRAEANLSVGKKLLRAEALGETLNEAIDLLEQELGIEIKKFKDKRTSLERKGARVFKDKRG